ncbi:hypothetical protein BH11ACT8_BH11ACT8_27410 [soil metagenome]
MRDDTGRTRDECEIAALMRAKTSTAEDTMKTKVNGVMVVKALLDVPSQGVGVAQVFHAGNPRERVVFLNFRDTHRVRQR